MSERFSCSSARSSDCILSPEARPWLAPAGAVAVAGAALGSAATERLPGGTAAAAQAVLHKTPPGKTGQILLSRKCSLDHENPPPDLRFWASCGLWGSESNSPSETYSSCFNSSPGNKCVILPQLSVQHMENSNVRSFPTSFFLKGHFCGLQMMLNKKASVFHHNAETQSTFSCARPWLSLFPHLSVKTKNDVNT